MNEKRWTIDDLRVIDDPLDHIRRHPRMYLGTAKASGALLAERIGSDLIFLGALPIKIDQRDGWWIVAAGSDWLAHETSVQGAFMKIRPFPERGVNDMHAEVLLTAFASSVVTTTGNGWSWITGSPNDATLPEGSLPSGGRLVAFRL